MLEKQSELKLKAKEVLDFTEQLDSFIAAQMTLDQSLQKLEGRGVNRKFI